MRATKWLLLSTGATVVCVSAADLSGDPSGLWKSVPAIYKIHSGIVADRTSPTTKDRKLTIHIDGKAAKELFDSIGPDVPLTCGSEKGERERRRKGIYCAYDPQGVSAKSGPYLCWVGMNLVTGDAETTVSC